MQVIQVKHKDRAAIAQAAQRAAEVWAAGGLVIFPTETVYGIGAPVTHEKAYLALRQFKERPDVQPFTIHLPSAAAAQKYADLSGEPAARLVRRTFPGPVTLVADAPDEVIEDRLRQMGLGPEMKARIYHQNTVGLRCPDDDIALAVLGAVDGPVAATSANRRAAPPPQDAAEAAAAAGDGAALLIDGGRSRYSKPSTVVRVRPGEKGSAAIEVLRDGVYDERYIRKMLRWTILFVCTGNTCRSPMAEVLAKQFLSRQRKITEEELDAAGIKVISAGLSAASGSPPTPEAVKALAEMGLSLSGHRSRGLTTDVVREADVIFCMTQGHQRAVLAAWPEAAGKVHMLDPQGDIRDPIGSSIEVYRETARHIEELVQKRLKEQQP